MATDFNVRRATVAGIITVFVIGIPTDIIPNSVFGREIPVRWWEYPVLGATAVLTALWFGISTAKGANRNGVAYTGVTAALFAVGCPVCNKLILLAIGTSGALSVWAPIQPVLAVVAVLALGIATYLRWQRRPCTDGRCATDQVDADEPVSKTAVQ